MWRVGLRRESATFYSPLQPGDSSYDSEPSEIRGETNPVESVSRIPATNVDPVKSLIDNMVGPALADS